MADIVVSTGRGGAGNMITPTRSKSSANSRSVNMGMNHRRNSNGNSNSNSNGNGVATDDSANEVIMTQEEWEKYRASHTNGHTNSHNHGHGHGPGYGQSHGKSHHDIILEAEEKRFHHDKDGKIVASSGRGGAGNIGKFDHIPSALVGENNETGNSSHLRGNDNEMELSPVFSTGRGGAGNMHYMNNNQRKKKKIEDELTEQLSPLHSNSNVSAKSAQGKDGWKKVATSGHIGNGPDEANDNGNNNGNSGFMKKIKKFFK
jgi:hypothetical protein